MKRVSRPAAQQDVGLVNTAIGELDGSAHVGQGGGLRSGRYGGGELPVEGVGGKVVPARRRPVGSPLLRSDPPAHVGEAVGFAQATDAALARGRPWL